MKVIWFGFLTLRMVVLLISIYIKGFQYWASLQFTHWSLEINLQLFFFLSHFDLVWFTAFNTTCNVIDEFECGNGDCINYTLTCDGMAHCKDKSDEKQSYCGESCCVHLFCCFSYLFQLSCSRARYLLDSYNWHLLPVSSSSANRVCKKGHRRCVNGRCVPHSAWCNGKDDCQDNSDETFCNSELRFSSLREQR